MKALIVFISLIIYGLFTAPTARALTKGELITIAQHVKAVDARREAIRQHEARVQRVRSFLADRGSPLASAAEALVGCADDNGLSVGLIVGITNAESSFGRFYQLPNNPWNWGVHNGTKFRSLEEGACTVARGLKQNYDLTSTFTIGRRFAPASDGNSPAHWATVVQQVINELDV